MPELAQNFVQLTAEPDNAAIKLLFIKSMAQLEPLGLQCGKAEKHTSPGECPGAAWYSSIPQGSSHCTLCPVGLCASATSPDLPAVIRMFNIIAASIAVRQSEKRGFTQHSRTKCRLGKVKNGGAATLSRELHPYICCAAHQRKNARTAHL